MRKVITDEMKTDISRMYKEGYGAKSIAEKFNIAVSTVKKYTSPKQKRFNGSFISVGKIEENKKICNERLKSFNINDKVIIKRTVRCGNEGSRNSVEIRKGKVEYSNDCYFTVALKNYRESFMYSEILAGDIEVKKVMV